MNGQHRIEEVSQVYAVCFGSQAQQVSVTVKTPGTTGMNYFQMGAMAKYDPNLSGA